MAGRHLRSRSVALEFEAAPRDSESCCNSIGLDCQVTESELLENVGSNTPEQQSPDNQVNNPEKSDDNILMYLKQFQSVMESVMKGFGFLNSKIQSENSKLAENLNAKLQADNLRLAEQIESNNKKLSETLTKQFKEENKS
jgi:hypothetical protein